MYVDADADANANVDADALCERAIQMEVFPWILVVKLCFVAKALVFYAFLETKQSFLVPCIEIFISKRVLLSSLSR